VLPHRHSFVEPPFADRLVEHSGRLLSVAEVQPAQIPRPLSLKGIRSVAVRAVLIEQTLAIVDHVGAAFERICDRRRCLLRSGNCRWRADANNDGERAAKYGQHPTPAECDSRGGARRRNNGGAGPATGLAVRIAVQCCQFASSKTTTAPPSELASMTF